jgi:hypothetical protein
MKEPDTGETRTDQQGADAKLAEVATEALRRDRELAEYDFEILALNGKVKILGTVSTFSQKERAEKLVTDIREVKEVDNSLSVGVPSGDHPSATGTSSGAQDAAPARDIAPGGAGSGTPCVRPT